LRYRKIGNTGLEASVLGFGTMRLKGLENTAEVVNRGIELGMNYFDLGAAYCWKNDQENAEVWVGKAIKGRPRESLILSDKAHCRPGEKPNPGLEFAIGVRNRDEMWRCIENSLRRVGVEWFDFYQFWDARSDGDLKMSCVGKDAPLQAMREAKEQGLVKHLGFTTHGQPADVIAWLKRVPEFRTVTIYHNFLDRYSEAILDYALSSGVGVNIMGPLRGGLLSGRSEVFARRLPGLGDVPVQQIALRFLLSHPGVTCVLTGANVVAHVEENAQTASAAAEMLPEEQEAFRAAFAEFSKGQPLCTGCRYCEGSCPESIQVYHLMGLYQAHEIFGMDEARRQLSKLGVKASSDLAKCKACKKCVEACPQKLPIPERMKRLAELVKELVGASVK